MIQCAFCKAPIGEPHKPDCTSRAAVEERLRTLGHEDGADVCGYCGVREGLQHRITCDRPCERCGIAREDQTLSCPGCVAERVLEQMVPLEQALARAEAEVIFERQRAQACLGWMEWYRDRMKVAERYTELARADFQLRALELRGGRRPPGELPALEDRAAWEGLLGLQDDSGRPAPAGRQDTPALENDQEFRESLAEIGVDSKERVPLEALQLEIRRLEPGSDMGGFTWKVRRPNLREPEKVKECGGGALTLAAALRACAQIAMLWGPADLREEQAQAWAVDAHRGARS